MMSRGDRSSPPQPSRGSSRRVLEPLDVGWDRGARPSTRRVQADHRAGEVVPRGAREDRLGGERARGDSAELRRAAGAS
jgi:hypothetical protein